MKNGKIKGRIGNQLFYVRNGVQCIRTMPKKHQKARTMAQIRMVAKMKMVMGFLVPLKEIIRHTCRPVNREMTGMNRAVQQVIAGALVEREGVFAIEPSRVMVSRGAHMGVCFELVKLEQLKLTLHWQNLPSHAYKQLFVLAYNIEQQSVQLSSGGDLLREGKLEMELNEALQGGVIELYAYASDRLGKSFSESQYLGRFEVS